MDRPLLGGGGVGAFGEWNGWGAGKVLCKKTGLFGRGPRRQASSGGVRRQASSGGVESSGWVVVVGLGGCRKAWAGGVG